jgi:hypothetical protein
MHTEIAAAGLLVTLATLAAPSRAQTAPTGPCHQYSCIVIFDWGGTPPDADRRYGNSSDLESAFLSQLRDLGYTILPSGNAAMTITLRITTTNRALCDSMEGTNPDYTCRTATRAFAVFAPNDSTARGLPRVDINPRCPDPTRLLTMSQFGHYAAAFVAYMSSPDPKPARPSARCS